MSGRLRWWAGLVAVGLLGTLLVTMLGVVLIPTLGKPAAGLGAVVVVVLVLRRLFPQYVRH